MDGFARSHARIVHVYPGFSKLPFAIGLALLIPFGLWGVVSRSRAARDHEDTPRQGDLDGRGNLSQRALGDFVTWFLRVCLDQIKFMIDLFEIDSLARRLRVYVERNDETLLPSAAALLEQVLMRGEVERGDASRITGLPERTARRVLNEVISEGLLASETPKGPVSLRFPTATLELLFPKLYPVA